MKAKRITIQDIAEKTGYSKTAVSFAFNSPSRISKEAVDKILQAAKDLDYIPDPMARNFSLGKHMALGFLLPQRVENSLANPYMQSVIRGIAEVCQDHGYMLTIIPPLHFSMTEAVKNATVDGLITLGFSIDKNIKGVLRKRRLPLVSIDGADDDDIHSVSIDNEKAAELQMTKVLEKGHRNIAVISLPDDAYAKPEGSPRTVVGKRRLGYMKALERYGLSYSSLIADSYAVTAEEGAKEAERILSTASPTCFVTMSDAAAFGVLDVLRKRNLDISVVGFDGLEDEVSVSERLTTIYQSGREKGLRSAEILFGLIEEKENIPLCTMIPYSFREGQTLKACAAPDTEENACS